MKILVVDDDPAVRDSLLAGALQLEGYDIELAGDGQEAVERLPATAVDAVVLDVSMPGWTGSRPAGAFAGRATRCRS